MNGAVLVTGATGNTGAPLVELLAQRGVAVRAMARDEDGAARLRAEYASRYGTGAVQIVVADFERPEQLADAVKGVAAAYLVTPSSERAQAQQEQFVRLAADAGVAHVVKLSQLAANESSPVRFLRYHAAVERRIQELDLGYTFLRPNLFFQGLLAMAATIRRQGRMFAPIGQARISAIDVRDIAAVAATALTEPGHTAATYTLTGPEAVTHNEIAAALTAATGHEVQFLDVTPAAFAEQLRGVLPDWQVDGLLEDYAHYARGEASEVLPTVAEITGRPARDLTGFATDYADAFR
jgi:uncharacterized protein YbjT (DUF2867 family)